MNSEPTVITKVEFIRRQIVDANNKHRLLSGGEASLILSDLKAIGSLHAAQVAECERLREALEYCARPLCSPNSPEAIERIERARKTLKEKA